MESVTRKFPLEAQCEVLRFLGRGDLERIQLTSRLYGEMVEKYFANEPLRRIRRFAVYGPASVIFALNDSEPSVRSNTLDGLSIRLRHSVVDIIAFDEECVVNERICTQLLPVKSAWADATCLAPQIFWNMRTFERFYSDVLFCRHLYVDNVRIINEQNSPVVGFLNYPTVSKCSQMTIAKAPFFLNDSEVIEWLTQENSPPNGRSLKIVAEVLRESVTAFTERLKEHFMESMEPHLFELEISSQMCLETPANFTVTNNNTMEELSLLDLPLHSHYNTHLSITRKGLQDSP
jgi:hypothetical protein